MKTLLRFLLGALTLTCACPDGVEPSDAGQEAADAGPLSCGDVALLPGMVCIEAGRFTDAASGPNEEHVIGRFSMDADEVTRSVYADCVAAGDCAAAGTSGNCATGLGELPVVCVTWFGADNYCRWAGKRLPTEWEWEWAARGREQARRYPWGDEEPTHDHACWAELPAPPSASPCPVGDLSPLGDSRDGVRDMAGNAAEWTDSWFSGNDGFRMQRGGEWATGPSNGWFRTDGRNGMYEPSDTTAGAGIRCVRSE